MLCVFKYITGVLAPRVFIDYKLASRSQYVRLIVHGRYYNSTGAEMCSGNSTGNVKYYYAGVLLINPPSLPAHVEVSFTKNRTSDTNWAMEHCNADSFSSYNTTVVKQGNHIMRFVTYFLFVSCKIPLPSCRELFLFCQYMYSAQNQSKPRSSVETLGHGFRALDSITACFALHGQQ